MVKEFLPVIRGLVAHELASKGLSQGKISRMIGVTQAAVSQYLAKDRSGYVSKARTLGLADDETARYTDLLCEDLFVSPIEGIQTLYTIWRNLLSRGVFCPAHQAMSQIPRDCDVCMRMLVATKADDKRSFVLEQMEKALRHIESSPYFPYIMPEVSVNLVMCSESAEDIGDVAAIPGRIVNAHGRPRAMMRPEFGASQHMARMLLAARSKNRLLGAAINVTFNSKIKSIVRGMNLRSVYTADKAVLKGRGSDMVVSAFLEALEKSKSSFTVVFDRGGPGLEPMTYVFGKDALGVCETAVEIASRYCRS